jgi:hypothetical protein
MRAPLSIGLRSGHRGVLLCEDGGLLGSLLKNLHLTQITEFMFINLIFVS